MRTLFFAAFLVFIGIANAQTNIEIPTKVSDAFNAKYSGVTKYKTLTKNKSFIFKFKYQKQRTEACFNKDGDWLYTSSAILVEDLPSEVFVKIKRTYMNSEISNVKKVIKPNGTTFIADVYSAEKELVVELTDTGEIIKSEKKTFGSVSGSKQNNKVERPVEGESIEE